jgi:translation initiation factor IF-2
MIGFVITCGLEIIQAIDVPRCRRLPHRAAKAGRPAPQMPARSAPHGRPAHPCRLPGPRPPRAPLSGPLWPRPPWPRTPRPRPLRWAALAPPGRARPRAGRARPAGPRPPPGRPRSPRRAAPAPGPAAPAQPGRARARAGRVRLAPATIGPGPGPAPGRQPARALPTPAAPNFNARPTGPRLSWPRAHPGSIRPAPATSGRGPGARLPGPRGAEPAPSRSTAPALVASRPAQPRPHPPLPRQGRRDRRGRAGERRSRGGGVDGGERDAPALADRRAAGRVVGRWERVRERCTGGPESGRPGGGLPPAQMPAAPPALQTAAAPRSRCSP